MGSPWKARRASCAKPKSYVAKLRSQDSDRLAPRKTQTADAVVLRQRRAAERAVLASLGPETGDDELRFKSIKAETARLYSTAACNFLYKYALSKSTTASVIDPILNRELNNFCRQAKGRWKVGSCSTA